ncbi:MAG: hypothetical protein NT124_01675 [Candidatus Dependentiae bacterium]|nr:hypothetical protein [Candidatus Dependentiae bacterium]
MNKITALLSLTITLSNGTTYSMLPAPAPLPYRVNLIEVKYPDNTRETFDIANISDQQFALIKSQFRHLVKVQRNLEEQRQSARRYWH